MKAYCYGPFYERKSRASPMNDTEKLREKIVGRLVFSTPLSHYGAGIEADLILQFSKEAGLKFVGSPPALEVFYDILKIKEIDIKE